jgi:hypothetical protein
MNIEPTLTFIAIWFCSSKEGHCERVSILAGGFSHKL